MYSHFETPLFTSSVSFDINTPKPFHDNMLSEQCWIRTFEVQHNIKDFVWHQDQENRIILVLDGVGWKFQFDNELPFDINKHDEIVVPKMVYHRLIPGTSSLRILISEVCEL